MNGIHVYNVTPAIPADISFLETLSRNLWWSWNYDAIELFRRMDPKLWQDSGHATMGFLSRLPQKKFEQLTEDDGFLTHLDQVRERFETEVLLYSDGKPAVVPWNSMAYFSLEYGIHESLKLYAGGLGCLAGDHLKSASDLGLPLVAVGILYRHGYFQQYLRDDGWQQESYQENEIQNLPLVRACNAQNKPVQISLPLPDGRLYADVWRLDVGRVPLFLLDTNIQENKPEHRDITDRLYEGDRQTRLRQELLLGIGGFRALVAMGYDPPACHMNEGHAGFVCLARIEHLMKKYGLDVKSSLEILQRTNIFTTHTPVPAGNEYFTVNLVKPHLEAIYDEIKIDPEEIISWGQANNAGMTEKPKDVCMTILGLKTSRFSNGVSCLHGRVERSMWKHLWSERPEDEVPISHVTNGIHLTSWLSGDNAQLFDRYLGPEWRDNPSRLEVLTRIMQIPDDELWKARELSRARLVRVARDIVEKQYTARSAAKTEMNYLKSILNHDVLTIGFARRFASYKRATLLLKYPDRLEALLCNRENPVQIIFAGKAHPADDVGKSLIQELIRFAKKANIRHRIAFLENYDIRIARYMVQGADIWLNTPRRPQEASGTSGMKAAVNGVINVSILDGWWDEAYSPECGWAIGKGEEYQDMEYQDNLESQTLYNLLENEVVPRFYDRQDSNVPVAWTGMMKASMRMGMEYFTSHRMLTEYNNRFYRPAADIFHGLINNKAERVQEIVSQHDRFMELWKNVVVNKPVTNRDISSLHVGDKFTVTVSVNLDKIKPEEVDVEVYFGPVGSDNRIFQSNTALMDMIEDKGNGEYVYKQEVACGITGRFGFTARIVPKGADWKVNLPGFITWPKHT